MLSREELQFWISMEETKDFILELEFIKNDYLKDLSGHENLESYARADGRYQAVCEILRMIEYLKPEEEKKDD